MDTMKSARSFLPRGINERRGGMLLAVALAVAGLVFAWQASFIEFGDFALPGPGFLPLVLGIAVFALSVAIGFEHWRRAGAPETVELGHRDVLIVFAALLAVSALFETLGAYASLGLFGTALVVLIARRSFVVASLAASIAMAGCWYFFQVVLGLRLPIGPF